MKFFFRTALFLLTLFASIITDAQVVVVGSSSSGGSKKNSDDKDKVYFFTTLKDAVFKRDVEDGFVIPYDSEGNPLDTIKANGSKWNGSAIVKSSRVAIPVSRTDTLLIFEAGAPGYSTETITWSFKPFGKRETYRDIPQVFLSKVRALKEVTVTASKVKFYNKGDTIVYDADAFQLTEGSMLDALVSQLPGAKVDENGRITVNGEFVETLLLNGKDFFAKDHSLMLENIPAYTVKTVEVYKGHTKEEKANFDTSEPKHLTMDVKLKKEYSNGWLVNFQGGYGTSDRYLARLFASWFSPTTNVYITALTNNLNSRRTPGKEDSWTPESMPSGSNAHRSANVGYTHESVDEKTRLNGEVRLSGSTQNYATSTSTTRFLNGANSFDRSFSNSKTSSVSAYTYHYGYFQLPQMHSLSYSINADYAKTDNFGHDLSATFDKDYADISREALDVIYTDGSPEQLAAIVNRSKKHTEGSLRSGSIFVGPSASFRIPNSNDRISVSAGFDYTTSKRRAWNDYTINFRDNPVPAQRLLQYNDESPNYNREIFARIGYFFQRQPHNFSINYTYKFSDRAKDSYMYALDRLGDMGIFGVLPENYASTLDPANSYTSSTQSNSHTISLMYNWLKRRDNDMFMALIMPTFGVDHHHLDYWRENRSYLVKRTSFIMPRTYSTAQIDYRFGKPEQGYNYRNTLTYDFKIQTEGPDLLHLVDVINDSDPLNIQEGNPHLKNALKQGHDLSWKFTPFGKPLNNRLLLSYNTVANALVRGYTYDTATGIRRFRTYNVSGNYTLSASNYFNYEFGNQKQFTLASSTSGSLINSTDMVGTDTPAPDKVQVRSNTFTEGLSLAYRIGKQQITLDGNLTHRHTTSERPDFNPINAQHYKYGVRGIFSLPAGFGISTDFYVYKRVGYGVKELDTTDPVWNMRLTYTPKNSKHWVFTLDGFDMLHRLSNVHYSVTAHRSHRHLHQHSPALHSLHRSVSSQHPA